MYAIIEQLKRTTEKILGIAGVLGILIILGWLLDISSLVEKPLGQWTGSELFRAIFFGCMAFSFIKGIHEVYGDD